MNLESLRSLQKRIREATGPDRELDAAISLVLHADFWASLDRQELRQAFSISPYTADPDGLGPCVALMREVLPGCDYERHRYGNYHICDGTQWHSSPHTRLEESPDGFGIELPEHANDCLTFLDAIFSAAIAQEEAKEKADV